MSNQKTEKKILLVGGGGHCRSVLDTVLRMKTYCKVGIIDPNRAQEIGAVFVGTDDDLPRLKDEGWTDAFVTVGSIGDTSLRRRLYECIKHIGYHIPIIQDPSALIADRVKIEEGAFFGKNTIVNSGSKVGCCSIINTGAIVEHDCVVDDFSHISPGAVLCGQVLVGTDSHIGAGSVIRQQITVGSHSLIGAGSIVVKDIPGGVKAYGNPCKVVDR